MGLMCGIFGHIGKTDSIKKCLSGLKFLEYRGYDSAGIAGILEGEMLYFKKKGKLSALEKTLADRSLPFTATIGHTRWATHGIANIRNAHPHADQMKNLALVHNGILENHQELRTMLEKKGIVFESDTDTEVIAQLIAHSYEGDLANAVRGACSLMKGFWALAIIHKKHPNQIIVTRLENPLIVGLSKQEAYISSDPYAFQEKDLDLFYLKNHEIGVVSRDSIQIFDQEARKVEVVPEQIDFPEINIDKGDYAHFMLKEIFEQPKAIQSSIHNRFVLDKGDADFEDFHPKKGEFTKIILLGCGTSWHAGCIAALQFEAYAKLPAQAEIASEYRYKQTQIDAKTLVIALSQSGETLDTIAAARKAKESGAKILVICNVPGSTLMRTADFSISLRAGPEISVCSTKAYNCQLAVLALLALKMGRLGPIDQKQGEEFLKEIIHLPKIVEAVLNQEETLIHLAQKYARLSNFFFIGRQYMFPTSLEAALKLKEISYRNAFAYPAGELKHGPIALIDPSCLIIGMCGNALTYDKMLSNLMEVKARGGRILAFIPLNAPEIAKIADDFLLLPSVSDSLASIPYSVASQLLAYYIAKEHGTDIDQPRNLAKSVTVE
ncbi:MAG: Glutamine--fructose-6-phosphate aminotransferase [isomerizing] [Chlamydiae bacterium]|nr:Glutamine--fructose-6-phosphate aminotransferase [isomerizing] [Chlamydiota bacterium]